MDGGDLNVLVDHDPYAASEFVIKLTLGSTTFGMTARTAVDLQHKLSIAILDFNALSIAIVDFNADKLGRIMKEES